MFHLFAVTLPGLEPFAIQELSSLGFTARLPQAIVPGKESVEEAGGVEFEGSLRDVCRANLHLRTANRILVRLGEFYASAFAELREKAAALPWEQFIRPGQPVAFRVTCHKSRLYHSDGVAERVAGAMADRLGKPVQIVKFDNLAGGSLPQMVAVRLVHDRCTISLNSSGDLLHRRGYRLETAKAPLRETIAAGMLLACGWDGSSPLLDPFCGSGTIPIEAALLARRIPPGKQRRFAFMDWPNADAHLWQSLLAEATSQELTAAPLLFASDRDAGAIRSAQANAERAGVAADIQFSCRAFSAIEPTATPGWLVTNPPYGVRVTSSHDLRNLYTRLGVLLRSVCPSWHVAILSSSDYLTGHTRLEFTQALRLVNGGIPVKLYLGQV